jgi:hypothetical protein
MSVLKDSAAMLHDQEWRVPHSLRTRIRRALSLFPNPHEPGTDDVPALEFLDEATMSAIVGQEFRHELQGYRDFRSYREAIARRFLSRDEESVLEGLLVGKRRQIRARLQDKRSRTGGGGKYLRQLVALW